MMAKGRTYKDDLGTKVELGAGQLCTICDHEFGPHAIIATSVGADGVHTDPVKGGIILCQIRDCCCFATWGFGDLEDVTIPDEETTTMLRNRIWAGAL